MERVVWQTLLYDFYGELLNRHQRSVYEEVVLNDISFSEAAEMMGVSRQGVHELIRRCDRILEDYEEKLHLVQKFLSIRRKVELIRDLSGTDDPEKLAEAAREIGRISESILEEL